jgi:hypothetical protein
MYSREWEDFSGKVLRSKIKLSLPVAKTIPKPTVGNFDLSSSSHSKFGLDVPGGNGFPFKDED